MTSHKTAPLPITTFLILALFALAAAAFYRLPALEERPMHTDEAILGYKFAQFQTTGHFQYDPKDFHGPALHYVTRAWSRMALWGGPETWTDGQLRTVSAVCGLLLLLVTLLFRDALGRGGVIGAMLLMAVSPMMVFYSRYFIMEILLVLLVALSLAGFWRYSQGGARWWLVLAGAAIGMQHATKETFILNAGAALVAWGVARLLVGGFEQRRSGFSLGPAKKRVSSPWLWVAIPAVFVSVWFFSGGFHDWEAVKNSALTYLNYLERSGGSGHEKPWHYYLTLLVWRQSDGVLWTEA
ncbi:MAG: glycosyltransferase family 39 protein, partial [Verrucomicrobiaceae bacterium]|nr:glycosyltransferase family 39 protein [Verrucomicrobiaceae bacterium]